MKRSIPNIGTSLFFMFFIPVLMLMFWDLIRKIIAENTVDLSILFLFFLGGMLVSLCLWIIFKFKIVKIDTKGIYAFYPFLNKRKQILWENFHGITAEVVDPPTNKLPSHRKIILKGKKGRERIVEISLTDREFENFNALTDAIPIPEVKTLRRKIDIEQAKAEKYVYLIYIVASSFGILWLLYKLFFVEIKLMIVVLLFLLLFLFILVHSTRKTVWFFKVLRMNK